MRIRILGKFWKLMFGGLKRPKLGECDSPKSVGKRIRINSTLKGQEELDTIIHEVFHAGFWHVDEEVVEEFGTDLARILWKLGYRRIKEYDLCTQQKERSNDQDR